MSAPDRIQLDGWMVALLREGAREVRIDRTPAGVLRLRAELGEGCGRHEWPILETPQGLFLELARPHLLDQWRAEDRSAEAEEEPENPDGPILFRQGRLVSAPAGCSASRLAAASEDAWDRELDDRRELARDEIRYRDMEPGRES